MPQASLPTPLSELAALFLRLGVTSFGGPVAHIAMIRHEVVTRRQWLTDPEFLDLVAATNLIPGPNSTELAIHIGLRRAGWRGLLVAGACFILPAALIVGLVAAAYTRYGDLPEISWLLYGVHPVVIGIVAVAIVQLAASTLRRPSSALIAAATAVLWFAGIHELILLATGALAGLAIALGPRLLSASACLVATASSADVFAQAAGAAAQMPVTLTRLTLFFVKVGSLLFGSGYVLLAFLRADLVDRWGWLTDRQLVDAISVGQVTPGPVFTTATFIGWLLGGWTGAALATLGIFLPAFLFVAVSHPLLPRLRRSAPAARMLDGLVAASLGLMVVVTLQLARSAIVDAVTMTIAAVTIVGLQARVNSAWLILAGAICGWLVKA